VRLLGRLNCSNCALDRPCRHWQVTRRNVTNRWPRVWVLNLLIDQCHRVKIKRHERCACCATRDTMV